MSHVVVLGGFTESKRLLEPIAEAAVDMRFGNDAEVLTLTKALKMDDELLRQRLAGASTITHSAGVMAVPDTETMTTSEELPAELTIIAGPELRLRRQLVNSANKKTFDCLFGDTEHARKDYRRIVAGNIREYTRNPFANFTLIKKISRFSTLDAIIGRRLAATESIGNFAMTDDVFFPAQALTTNQELNMPGNVTVAELPGKHDEILLDPASVLLGARLALHAGRLR